MLRNGLAVGLISVWALGCGGTTSGGAGGAGASGSGAGGGTSSSSSGAGASGGGASIDLTGTIDGEHAFAKNVAAERWFSCAVEGFRIMTSSNPDIDPCVEKDKPYLELFVVGIDPGTYTPVEEDQCNGGGNVFWGNAEGMNTSTLDVDGGQVVIKSVDATSVEGTFHLTLAHDGESGHGSLDGSFTAPRCE